jgi:hypothetical protein
MKTAFRIRPSRSLLAAGLALFLAIPANALRGAPRSSGTPTSGRWILDFDADGWIELTLKRRSDNGNWNSSNDYKTTDFQGLTRPAGTGDTPARFQMVRDAGTLAFEGHLAASGGAGTSPSPPTRSTSRR